MFCPNCGRENDNKSRFCVDCGTKLNVPESEEIEPTNEHNSMSLSPPSRISSKNHNKQNTMHWSFQNIVVLIFAALYVLAAVRGIPSLFGCLGTILSGRILLGLINLVIAVAKIASSILFALMLFLYPRHTDAQESEAVLLGICGAAALHIAVVGVTIVLFKVRNLIVGYSYRIIMKPYVQTIAFALVVLAIVYGMSVIVGTNKKPFVGKSKAEFKAMLRKLSAIIIEDIEEFSVMLSKKQVKNSINTTKKTTKENSIGMESERIEKMKNRGLKTNRSLLKYIIFSILTVGIYPLILTYEMARDLNQICEGDGKQTSGLAKTIVLTLLTCGIYWYIWIYAYAERMADNAPRYGVTIRDSGATVLLWYLVGIVLCGIGPLVAMHMMLSNLNKLAQAYNESNNLQDSWGE